MGKMERTAGGGTGGGVSGGIAVEDLVQRAREVYTFAEQMVRQSPDWLVVFREIFGPGGVARRLFPTAEEMEQFEKTVEYRAVQQFIAQLREASSENAEARNATRMITVRLPKTLHESLRDEAHARKTSLNKLCVWKLLQALQADPSFEEGP